jgi:RimJ/RimL family protein N-acetyltransferase
VLSELPPIGTVAQGDRDIGGDAACMRMGMAELRFATQLLTDEVVLLRPWRETDVPAKLMAFSEPLVQRFPWPRSTPYTEADARRYFVEQEQARLRGEELNFAFVEPEGDDVVLGGGSLYDVELEQRRAAVGYWLAPEARGRGVATRAVRLIARWAFEDLEVARLELTCSPDNHASQRVAERCGFTRQGLLRSHTQFKGERRDTVVFRLLSGELQ